jgi:Serine acetyltransferase, N-terminal
MVPDGISSRGALWRSIRREAETALANDPIFGSSLSTSIFAHSSLGAAVSHQIGQRLGKNIAEQHQFTRVANEAFAASPGLSDAAHRDLEGIVLHDPASTALLPALLNFKGYVALQAWRVSNCGSKTGATLLCCCKASHPIRFRSASIRLRRSGRRCSWITPPVSWSAPSSPSAMR